MEDLREGNLEGDHYPQNVDPSSSAVAANDDYMTNGNFTQEGDPDLLYNDSYWNGTYPLDEEIEYPLGFKIAIIILYNTVFVTAVLGNALVCYVVFASPRMRTVTNYLIANLAVGDLLMAVLCVPFSYIPVLLQHWPFGHFLCYLLPPAQAVGVLVSSYTLVALAADRYMAILYPLRPRFRRSQACWVIAGVWVIAVISASPIAIFTGYNPINGTDVYYCEESGWEEMGVENLKLPYGFTLMILQYFFPLTVLIFTYSRIAMAVWGKKSLGEAEDSRDQRLAKTKRKTVVMSLAVVCSYTAAFLPLNIYLLIGDRISWYPQYVFFACHMLAMGHTMFNPVIYAWMNIKFRTQFLFVLSRLHLLCPCLLNLCLAGSSNASPNANQYPFSPNHHHHNLYYHQQTYSSSAHGSNKLLLQQNNRSNLKKKAYQLNGSVKSTLDSDPLVLITIPTHQLNNHTRMSAIQTTAIATTSTAKENKQIELSPKVLNTTANNSSQQANPICVTPASSEEGKVVIINKTTNNGYSAPSTPTPLNHLTLDNSTTTHQTPVDIMTTAKDEDLIEDEDDDMEAESPMIKMMLTVVFVYTISWLPLNIFIICGDIWYDDIFHANGKAVRYMYPVILWLAMAHSVWNPIIYCYMNSRFREGFKAAVSNVPCVWKLIQLCQLRGVLGGQMTDSRRSYSTGYMNRLTRTNTSCTTYTFGSLHNLHNHTNHLYAGQHPPLRKQSYLGGIPGSNGARPSCASIISQYPKVHHNHMLTSSKNAGSSFNHRNLISGVKPSNTMTSIAPAAITPPSTPPSGDGSVVNLPLTCLQPRVSNGDHMKNIDLNVTESCVREGGIATLNNSPSYVSISSRGGKDTVVSVRSTPPTSHKSGVSESFM